MGADSARSLGSLPSGQALKPRVSRRRTENFIVCAWIDFSSIAPRRNLKSTNVVTAILAAVEGGILPLGPAPACREKLASPVPFRRARCPALRQARTPAATTWWYFQVA